MSTGWLATIVVFCLASPAGAADFAAGSRGAAVPQESSGGRALPHDAAPLPPPSPALRERAVTTAPASAAAYVALGRSRDGRALSVPPSQTLRGLLTGTDRDAGAAPAGEGDRSTFFPIDERVQVADTTQFPFRTIGYLQAADGNGDYSSCTGFLVAPRAVVTPAHCLYDHEAGGWKTEMVFAPGLASHDALPSGYFGYEEAYVPAAYVDGYAGHYGSVMPWDLGLVILSEPVGQRLGWMPFGTSGATQGEVSLVGYPGDKPAGTMWRDRCRFTIDDASAGLMTHDCLAWPGTTGAPLVAGEGDGSRAVGVHVARSPDAEVALELTPIFVQWINGIAR